MDNTPKPITDLSPRVVSLARELDRLPPGEYTVTLRKPDLGGMPWRAEITRIEPIRTMDIPRKGM